MNCTFNPLDHPAAEVTRAYSCPHPDKKEFPQLRWSTLEPAHVLPRWLAITIPACMFCDRTCNVCNAKERR